MLQNTLLLSPVSYAAKTMSFEICLKIRLRAQLVQTASKTAQERHQDTSKQYRFIITRMMSILV